MARWLVGYHDLYIAAMKSQIVCAIASVSSYFNCAGVCMQLR